MRKTIIMTLAFVCSIFLGTVSFAQGTRTITGTIKDTKGQPVIGSYVTLEGKNNVAAVADMDGKYKISIPEGSGSKLVLKAQCISYKSQTAEVNKNSIIDFILQEDNELLDEVVVVGYGSMRKSDLTGSISSVRINEDKAASSNSLDELLTGAAAGVQVLNNSASPDAGVSIRIRGTTSLNGSSEPLYVVDGVIMTDDVSGDFTSETSEESNGLMGLNPQDIASIEILKDASATAIYGADGANGVVLITTKQASKERPVIQFNAGLDYNTPFKKIDILSFDEYVDFLSQRTDDNAVRALKRMYEKPSTREGIKVRPVDWQDYTMQNVLNQRYFFSISGKPGTLRYSMSLGYNQKQGIVRSTGVDQYTAKLNVDKSFTKKFTVGTKVNFAFVDAKSQQGANSDAVQASSSMMKAILSYRPYVSKSASADDDVDDEESDDIESMSGPNRWLTNAKSTRKEYRITPSVYFDWKIIPELSFKTTFGGDFRSSERTQWKGRKVSRSGSVAGVSDTEKYRWSWDNLLNFNKKIKKHSISGTLGFTVGSDKSSQYNSTATNVIQEDLQIDNINSAYKAQFLYSEVQNSRVSFFARALYNYADRYVLTLTYRLDGSSKFRKENRFANFPSAALAWRINEEPWFKVAPISALKLRLGWGMVGNSSVSPYQTYNLYSSSATGDHTNDAGYSRGIYQGNFSNTDLKWETTQQWNVGLDMSFLKGRIAFTFDAYDKTTYDLLQTRMVPLSSGYSTMWVNQGTIRNRGLEFTLDVVPVKTRNFEWTIDGNISLNRNVILDLGNDMDKTLIYLEKDVPSYRRYYLGASVASSTYLKNPANIFMEGMPIGLFYGYKTDGIVQEGETGIPIEQGGTPQQPGQIKYVDMNGNGYLDEYDRTVIGDYNPKFTYGFNTTFSFYGFTVSLNFDGVYGKNILNANIAQLTDPNWQSCTNILKDAYYKAWTPENPNTKYVAINGGWTSNEKAFITDRFIEDASYLRLSRAAVSYRFKIPKTFKVVKGINLGVAAGNVFMITNYSGWSPMVNSFGRSMTKIGIDLGSYPMARTWSFDVKLTF